MKGPRKPRIKGLETEYSIKSKKFRNERNKIKLPILNNPEKMVDGFLPNGARYYVDSTKYPEFATPECLSVKDVVIFDKAGERILLNDFSQFCRSIQKANYGIGQEGFFNLKAGTRGCHENYLIDERLMTTPRDNSSILALIPFLVSRQILAGRGGLALTDDGKIIPVISKRVFAIYDLISDATAANRAIICTARKNESFSQSGYRLHLILGDSNLSEYSTFLKIGTADLMLTLLENNFLPHLQVDDPLTALRWISFDTKFKKTYGVTKPSGERKKFSALDFQFWHLNLAQKFFETRAEPTEEEKFILNLWQETLDGLKRDPMSLSDRLDYLIVLRLFEEAKNILGSSLNDEQLKQIDFNYSELLPEKNWYLKQVKTGNIKRLSTDEEIDRAIDNPPNNTRAKLRGELIKMILKEKIGEFFIINWDIIQFTALQQVWSVIRQIILTSNDYDHLQTLYLKDPYQTESSTYNAFKNMIAMVADKLRTMPKEEKKKIIE